MGQVKEYYHDQIEESVRTDHLDDEYQQDQYYQIELSPCCQKPIKWIDEVLYCTECLTLIDDLK